MTLIPETFQNRIHELDGATPNYSKRVNIMRVSENVGRVALETDEYLLGIVDREIMEFVFYVEPNEGTYKILRDAQERGIKYRVLAPPSFNPSMIHKKALDIQRQLIKGGTLEYRIIDSIEIFLHMSEKEASIIAFPDKDGLFDYLGFEAKDQPSLRWCRELFEYYWAQSEPVSLI
jgi:predicted transcriptional regulator